MREMKTDVKASREAILGIVAKMLNAGDPWTLSDIGVKAIYNQIEAALDGLFSIIDNISNDKERRNALHCLNFLFGSLSEMILYFHNIELVAVKQAEQARTARATNQESIEREARLINCIKEEIRSKNSTYAFALSDKFSRIIRPGVLARMNIVERDDAKQWPSISTIKSRLKQIKAGKP